jgi:tetratricopeptide (TPR) repeat protein
MQVDPREYLRLYRAHGKHLRRRSGGDHNSVTTTFALAFDKVALKDAAAADLLRLCAFLAPDAIPEEIFEQGAAFLGTSLRAAMSRKLSMHETIRGALSYSLLRRDPSTRTLTIHRLVQEVLGDTMPRRLARSWTDRAVNATNAAFPLAFFEQWPACERLLPHAIALCQRIAKGTASRTVFASQLLSKAARYMNQRGRIDDAGPMLLLARQIQEDKQGTNHPETVACLMDLAVYHQARCNDREAESLYREILRIQDALLPKDDPDRIVPLHSLAFLLSRLGRELEAKAYHLQALSFWNNVLSNPILLDARRYKDALTVWKQVVGPEAPNTPKDIKSYSNYYRLYKVFNMHKNVDSLVSRAMHVVNEAMGQDARETADASIAAATLYHAIGRMPEAERLFRKALEIRRKKLGDDSPETGSALNDLALLLAARGQLADSERFYRDALEVFERSLGPTHQHTCLVRENLERLPRSQGRAKRTQKRGR